MNANAYVEPRVFLRRIQSFRRWIRYVVLAGTTLGLIALATYCKPVASRLSGPEYPQALLRQLARLNNETGHYPAAVKTNSAVKKCPEFMQAPPGVAVAYTFTPVFALTEYTLTADARRVCLSIYEIINPESPSEQSGLWNDIRSADYEYLFGSLQFPVLRMSRVIAGSIEFGGINWQDKAARLKIETFAFHAAAGAYPIDLSGVIQQRRNLPTFLARVDADALTRQGKFRRFALSGFALLLATLVLPGWFFQVRLYFVYLKYFQEQPCMRLRYFLFSPDISLIHGRIQDDEQKYARVMSEKKRAEQKRAAAELKLRQTANDLLAHLQSFFPPDSPQFQELANALAGGVSLEDKHSLIEKLKQEAELKLACATRQRKIETLCERLREVTPPKRALQAEDICEQALAQWPQNFDAARDSLTRAITVQMRLNKQSVEHAENPAAEQA